MTTTSLCDSCGAEIRWVTTEGGRPMPLDPAPHPNGNVVVGLRDRYRVLTGPQLPAEGVAWRSHFATCPHASRHRRGRRRPVTAPPPTAPPVWADRPTDPPPAAPAPDPADDQADDQLSLFDLGGPR